MRFVIFVITLQNYEEHVKSFKPLQGGKFV